MIRFMAVDFRSQTSVLQPLLVIYSSHNVWCYDYLLWFDIGCYDSWYSISCPEYIATQRCYMFRWLDNMSYNMLITLLCQWQRVQVEHCQSFFINCLSIWRDLTVVTVVVAYLQRVFTKTLLLCSLGKETCHVSKNTTVLKANLAIPYISPIVTQGLHWA